MNTERFSTAYSNDLNDFYCRLHEWGAEWIRYCNCYEYDKDKDVRYLPDFEYLREEIDPANQFAYEINQLQKYYRRRAIFEAMALPAEEIYSICYACGYPATTGCSYDCCYFCDWENELETEEDAYHFSGPNGISLTENRIAIGKTVNIIAKKLNKRISTNYAEVYQKISYYNNHYDELPKNPQKVDCRLYEKFWHGNQAERIARYRENFILLALEN